MQLRTIQFHTIGQTSVVASLLFLPLACATAPTPTAVAPPAGPADVAFNRLREDEAWARQRRQQLDVLFGRVVDASASPAALDWLRVEVRGLHELYAEPLAVTAVTTEK